MLELQLKHCGRLELEQPEYVRSNGLRLYDPHPDYSHQMYAGKLHQ